MKTNIISISEVIRPDVFEKVLISKYHAEPFYLKGETTPFMYKIPLSGIFILTVFVRKQFKNEKQSTVEINLSATDTDKKIVPRERFEANTPEEFFKAISHYYSFVKNLKSYTINDLTIYANTEIIKSVQKNLNKRGVAHIDGFVNTIYLFTDQDADSNKQLKLVKQNAFTKHLFEGNNLYYMVLNVADPLNELKFIEMASASSMETQIFPPAQLRKQIIQQFGIPTPAILKRIASGKPVKKTELNRISISKDLPINVTVWAKESLKGR